METTGMRELCNMVCIRILNNPKKAYCTYRLGYNWVIAIKDHKTNIVTVYPIILN